MTTEIGRFVIDDGQQDLVTIADVASAAAFNGVIVHALREGLNVRYRGPDEVIQIAAPAAPKPTVNQQPAKVVHKRAGKRRAKKVSKTPAAAPAPAPTPPATTDNKKAWNVGDVVFIAWRTLTTAERETFNDIREAMGVVHAIQRGRGIRRTVGVK